MKYLPWVRRAAVDWVIRFRIGTDKGRNKFSLRVGGDLYLFKLHFDLSYTDFKTVHKQLEFLHQNLGEHEDF